MNMEAFMEKVDVAGEVTIGGDRVLVTGWSATRATPDEFRIWILLWATSRMIEALTEEVDRRDLAPRAHVDPGRSLLVGDLGE
jgi:hypothetical protein